MSHARFLLVVSALLLSVPAASQVKSSPTRPKANRTATAKPAQTIPPLPPGYEFVDGPTPDEVFSCLRSLRKAETRIASSSFDKTVYSDATSGAEACIDQMIVGVRPTASDVVKSAVKVILVAQHLAGFQSGLGPSPASDSPKNVAPAGATVDEYNALVDRYNSLVRDYNAMLENTQQYLARDTAFHALVRSQLSAPVTIPTYPLGALPAPQRRLYCNTNNWGTSMTTSCYEQ